MTGNSRIAVVGGLERERARVVDALARHDLRASAHATLVLDEPGAMPAVVVVVGAHPVALVAEARATPPLADVPILVIADDGATADAILEQGATDVAVASLTDLALANRVRLMVSVGRLRGPWTPGSLAPALVRVNDILGARGDDAEALVETLELTRECLGFDRASLIAHIEGSVHGFVIAATDDPERTQFTIAIADYPELVAAIRTGEPVLIDDARAHPMTSAAVAHLADPVAGVAVFPVMWRGRSMGAMLLRKKTPGARHVVGRGEEFARLIASITAAHLRHGAVLESLRDQTHRISRTRYEAERRLRGIESLKEHFEAASDGVVIIDEHGLILFVNRAAERITGFARDGLTGRPLTDLLVADAAPVAAGVVEKVLAGENLDPFDLGVATTTGERMMVSASTSTVLAATGAAILTFRDVTAQRALEGELRATKEFLERLIDSTVDAIVAADMRGQVILFNRGAERLYGYRSDEVIGKVAVWDLYADGVPRQIMRTLRSTSHGGVGYLEQTRREVKRKGGELIPVNMTASIIYEGGREVATVGIFADLRDRIRIEQRLLAAQEKLQITEKQALVAELAGAAAHELNQPLTSILGYAQLIQRQSPPEAAHLRAVGVIRAEAERMADIVKKIGRITKYETMPYVGGASIIDLDRSTAGEVPLSETSSSGDDPLDGSRTREFSAVRVDPELMAGLELEELLDDPAESSSGSSSVDRETTRLGRAPKP
ncbi:MAG: PAS domain S-box protein [Myxococcales bacterium]|nr:PAS domain S-box protein [Myxococcales bacterium]